MNKIEEKKFTYWGVSMIVFLSLVIVIFFSLFLIMNELSYMFLFFIVGFLFCLLCFYKITITIDDTYFSFKLGIGLVKKRYKIENIKSCKPYSGIHKGFGIGTKMNFAGEVLKQYNVTGIKAIEIRLYDDNAIIKIGTNQPDEISQYVQSIIEKK